MKLTRLLAPALGVAVVAASAGTATAAPDKPQRLRGMEDRSFAVEVTLPDGSSFPNCYTFEADGTWIDPAAPEGVWSQRGVGSYTATSDLGVGVLSQRGIVTPTGEDGGLELRARTYIPAGAFGPDPLTVVSIGSEVESCGT